MNKRQKKKERFKPSREFVKLLKKIPKEKATEIDWEIQELLKNAVEEYFFKGANKSEPTVWCDNPPEVVVIKPEGNIVIKPEEKSE